MSYTDRFGGIARLYGQTGLVKLQAATVCVVGIGGVGSWAAEALARSGVGHLRLIDMDDICITNTNRQIHAHTGNIGREKITAMAERIKAINPECEIDARFAFATAENMAECVQGVDYVIDAIDSVKAKVALIAYCKRFKIPVITTGAAGGQIDPTQVTVGDLNKTFNDPLAKKVRSLLRRDHGFSRNEKRTYGVPCVFSTEQLRYPQPDGSVCQQKQFNDAGVKLDCAGGFGSVTMVTGTFGFVAAARVVAKLAAD
ncbi:MAG: tRNA cyclic N6-threonylcarbamoyladenosine(37) synthase TcdA [Oceanospirillaceae bacterium]|nr:tRNA cyclic N6-threonylcarbamoyladenosine(37) synthase TcdA [Oceanospirillaceae bacterium]